MQYILYDDKLKQIVGFRHEGLGAVYTSVKSLIWK